MALYLLRVADRHVARLESLLGGALIISSAQHGDGVLVAALDAVTDEEAAAIRARLATSGHYAGGPDA
jgi:hypothetical protein